MQKIQYADVLATDVSLLKTKYANVHKYTHTHTHTQIAGVQDITLHLQMEAGKSSKFLQWHYGNVGQKPQRERICERSDTPVHLQPTTRLQTHTYLRVQMCMKLHVCNAKKTTSDEMGNSCEYMTAYIYMWYVYCIVYVYIYVYSCINFECLKRLRLSGTFVVALKRE